MQLHDGIGRYVRRFDEEWRFFKGWTRQPRTVGSLVPTSRVTARRMASVVDAASGLPVLELGPGTGVITRAILEKGVPAARLYAIEYSEAFARRLAAEFPDVHVLQGDAFDLDTTLGQGRNLQFDCAISGIPLLNFPVPRRIAYVESLLDRLPAGRPVMQLTYGPLSPIPPGMGNYEVSRFDFVLRNIPPTTLWVYRRAAGGATGAGPRRATAAEALRRRLAGASELYLRMARRK